MSMIRWPAVAAGFIVAALLAIGLGVGARMLGIENLGTHASLEFLALIVGGYVAGRLGGQIGMMQGVAVAIVFILISASTKAWWEIQLATAFGPQVLGPMDMGGLLLGDLIHLTGACVGGWLSDLQRPDLEQRRS